jgi:type VI secretion system protein ImpM
MRCGLFGKIQSKRDFIAVGTPRLFLSVWEPWIQSAISASRTRLGRDWQPAFLTAPVWRFWLGADVCGKTVLGATMASMDKLGRYFPLTLIALASEKEPIAPPEIDPQDQWFALVEGLLFMTLEQDRCFEDITHALESLPPPAVAKPGSATQRAILLPQGASLARVCSESFVSAFADARVGGHGLAYAANTCWWTVGGEGYEPVVLTALRMPDPYLYVGMLTGHFENAAAIDS